MTDVELLLQTILKGSTVRSIALQSEALDVSTDWKLFNTTVTANAGLDPDGGSTADDMVETAGFAGHSIYQECLGPSPKPLILDKSVYTCSMYAMAQNRSIMAAEFWGHNSGPNDWFQVYYNLVTGETRVWYYNNYPTLLGSLDPRIGMLHGYLNHGIEDAANGFKRCWFSFRTELANFWAWSAVSWYSAVGMGDGTLVDIQFVGDDTQPALRLWGGMMSATPYLTPYKPAVAAPLIDTSAAQRVYPLLRPQGSSLPAVTYQQISSVPATSMNGDSHRDQVRVQIDCWGSTFAEAKLLGNEVRDAMNAGSLAGILKSRPDTGFDDYVNETQTFRSSRDYLCWRK